MNPVIHRVARTDELLTIECELCILEEVLLRPFPSLICHIQWYSVTGQILERFKGRCTLKHDIYPCPLRYILGEGGPLATVWPPFVDCVNASALPILRHWAICVHVLAQSWQLEHSGLLPFWCAKNFILPATPKTCLQPRVETIGEEHAASGVSIPNPWTQIVRVLVSFGHGGSSWPVAYVPKI